VSRAAPGPEDRHAHSPGTDGGAGAGCAEAVVGTARPAGRVLAALAGFRAPVVWILLAIAFFTSISGKPVDGALMLIVATGLAWDAGRRVLRHPETGRYPEAGHGAEAQRGAEAQPAGRYGSRRRLLAVAALLACGVAYAAVVGSFTRYSWPATAGIVGLGTVVVVIGWHGPRRDRPAGGRLPVAGTLAWLVVLVAGCLWELDALLQQPSITTDSYAHPTISTLTDPVLATSPGRSVVLLAWLALGWYLVER
jgi:lysylphosphatidylglycerol synthetase-like protein (DUF2156 family)